MKNDKELIYERYLTVTEERRDINSPVVGIDVFLDTIKTAFQSKYPNIGSILAGVRSFINQSRCPAIKFKHLTGALGISLSDKCIVADRAMSGGLSFLLYVIFHEISHQYQYSKYGEKFVQDVYNDEMSLEDAAQKLMKIENIADRHALMSVKKLYSKYMPDKKIRLTPLYKGMSVASFASQIEGIRLLARQRNLTDIEDINKMIYNMIKPRLTTADDLLF